MADACILTDNLVQFPIPAFAGRDRVYRISLDVDINGQRYPNTEGLKTAQFPPSATPELAPKIFAPSIDAIERMLVNLSNKHDGIVLITHGAQLTNTYTNAVQAAKRLEGQAAIEIVDSGSAATGQGLMVQAAAAAAEEGVTAADIEQLMRKMLPRIYSLFCLRGISYLHYNGDLTQAQTAIAEYTRMTPLFVLDNGKFSPTQKARNNRHLVDLLHEFVCEFPNLDHIGILQGVPAFENETRALRERIAEDYPGMDISEHIINPVLAALIGPQSLGVFLLQSES